MINDSNQGGIVGDIKDARDIFKFLKLELESKEPNILPLKMEILYL